MRSKPFALIGVNISGDNAQKIKEVTVKEELSWRSFVDHNGAIIGKWNPSPGTFYVIDHKGMIRYKWLSSPGEKAIDAALDKTIHEAEADQKNLQK